MQGSFTYGFCFGRQEKTKNALQRFLIFLSFFDQAKNERSQN
jgi:hypothetical protein